MSSNPFSTKELEKLENLADRLDSGNFRCNVETMKDSYIGACKFMENPECYEEEKYLSDVHEASKSLNNSDSLNDYFRKDKYTKYTVMVESSEAFATIIKSGLLRNVDPINQQPYRYRSRKVGRAIEVAYKYL